MKRKIETKLDSLNNDNKKKLTLDFSLNNQISNIISSNTKNAISVIVDINGNGNYTTIKEAVESGASLIKVKNGTYSIDEDLELINQKIIGDTQKGVIINLNNSTIKTKDVSNITSNGTVQFVEDDKTVNGNNTAFLNLEDIENNMYLYSEGRTWEIDSIVGSTIMDLKTKMFGKLSDALTGSTLKTNQISFEANSYGAGLENLTLNHIISQSKKAIVINGYRNSIKNVLFYDPENLSTFITISKSDTEITLKTTIKNCYFEGGSIAIRINRAFDTRIEDNYFTSSNDKCIEIFTKARYTDIINNNFTSGYLGIIANTKKCRVIGNHFSYIENNAIKTNYTSLSTDISYNQILDNSFYNCNTSEDDSEDGALAIRGANTIINNSSFYKCTRAIVMYCKESILSNTNDIQQNGIKALNIVSNNIIINNFCSDKNIFSGVLADFTIYNGISANEDNTLAILEQGLYSIAMNMIHKTEDYYHGNDNILFNTFIVQGQSFNSSNQIVIDNDHYGDSWLMDGTETIMSFNQLLDAPNDAIDVPQDSVCKGNFVKDQNPPTTDSAVNNISIYNFF